MRKLIGVLGLAAAAVLAGCGGGGGSAGDTQERYSITLRVDKPNLPLNFTREWPYLNGYAGSGTSAPYTTTLYVQAMEGGDPILGNKEAFECDVKGGLDSGVLMYMDGDEDHYEEVDVPGGGKVRIENAYRSIVLGANSGGNSFHFHALDQAGMAKVTCSVTDPRDSRVYSASVDISVGGGSGSGKAASVVATATDPTLGIQRNLYNLRTSTAVSAYVWDDSNQPVPAGGAANLQVSIVRASGDAAQGARLFADGKQGSVLQVKTTGGVGLFSLASGSQEGPILLEMATDRLDNDVTNGLQDPITGYLVVFATEGVPSGVEPDPIEFVDITPAGATNGLPYSYVLSVQGGVPPYKWTALGRLPDGLTLNSSGLLSGTPNMANPGPVSVAIAVTDGRGVSQTANLIITVAAAPEPPPTPTPEPAPPAALSINLSGCGSSVNTACDLGAPVGGLYQYALTATGGAGTGAVSWAFEPPAPGDLLWLTLSTTGILQGNVPVTCGAIGNPFFIKATKGSETTIRKVQILGVSGPGGSC